MKKILTLAIAAALSSPMALAANTPDTVGDVTYLGNIVANSPMWQWTVNDYPGGRLDAKPSTATTASGVTTYPLNGQSFIAVSGYLPAMLFASERTESPNSADYIGIIDKTAFTDSQGNAPSNVIDAKKGAVSFTIYAQGTNQKGVPVDGKLTLFATELRGARSAEKTTSSGAIAKQFSVFGSTALESADTNSSCFIGVGSYTAKTEIVSGTAIAPVKGEMSSTAWNALMAAFENANNKGNAEDFRTLFNAPGVARSQTGCDTPTAYTYPRVTHDASKYQVGYRDAAHVVELTPQSLKFSEPLSGAWSSTLTVTAYQM